MMHIGMTRMRQGFFDETTSLQHEPWVNAVSHFVKKPFRTRAMEGFVVQVAAKSS